MIAANFDICGSGFSSASAKDQVLASGFQEIVFDLEWTFGEIAASGGNRLRIGARSTNGDTMKIGKIRIDDCGVCHRRKVNAAARLALRGTMHPHAVEDNVIRATSLF